MKYQHVDVGIKTLKLTYLHLFLVVFHTFRRLEVGQESRIHLPHILRRLSSIRYYDRIQCLWLC